MVKKGVSINNTNDVRVELAGVYFSLQLWTLFGLPCGKKNTFPRQVRDDARVFTV